MTRKLFLLVGIGLLLIAASLVAWDSTSPLPVAAQDGGDGEESGDAGDAGECPDGPCPDWIVEAWQNSPHADAESEAFRHWDEDDPAEVPTACAKCHSEGGHLDFLGADGSAEGAVDAPASIDTVVSCTVCHNPVSAQKTDVTFPSGVTLDVGSSARCMVCHQGRASGMTVDTAIEEAGLDMDEPSEDLRFINIHYFAAAASLYGSDVHGGYEYEGMRYQPQFSHVESFDTCAECHSPHSLEIQVNECAACHAGVESVEDLSEIRMAGSLVDYDGDGSVDGGVRAELEGLQAKLYEAIQAYASNVIGTPIVYDSHSYPYFFVDTNEDGEVSEDEAAYANAYSAFSPRLLKAAYNFQMYEKDPGAYAHNAKYYVQLLHDSVMSLNEALDEPIEMGQTVRDDAGHFDSTSEAFRHWDEDDPAVVSARCSKCHTSEGLPFFLEHGTTISFEPSNSLACETCHSNLQDFSLYEVMAVEFPSGAELGFENDLGSNLCLNCHQGRQSTVSVNNAIEAAGVGPDEVSEELGFVNVHYFAAGATVFGSEAMGAYQYPDKEYLGRFVHVPQVADTCASCHNAHTLEVPLEQCVTCHSDVESFAEIRMTSLDYDGDGADEGIKGEIETLHDELYAAIQSYAADTIGTPIVYDSHSYPYWFTDTDGDGEVSAEEANYGNQYANWTPALLRAAYNYQYVAKDPGAFVHNGKYVTQVLYDSLEAIAGEEAVSGYIRP